MQVTKHTDGSLFWPSMSSDGKVIVYEENFGIWKLDVASGRTSEIKIEIATDEKENEFEVETVTNEVDSFDLSPSGRRAVISARGQILTIATERGDITRVAPDAMASRSQFPKWSPDGKYLAFVSDRSGRDEIWISDPEGKNLKKITNLDNEKGALALDARLEDRCSTRPPTRSCTATASPTRRRRSSRRATIGRIGLGRRCRPTASGWRSPSRTARSRSHVYIAPIGGGEERHVSDDRLLYSENNAVWTGDGRYLVFTSSEGVGNGIATQGGISDDHGAVGAVAARSGARSGESRHRQRGAGARGRGGGSRGGAGEARDRAPARRLTCASTGTISRDARGRSTRARRHDGRSDVRRLTADPSR